jgi:hypothetical protein
MRRITVLVFAAGFLGLPGCAFHHVDYPDPDRPSNYIDWEPDPYMWGGHVHHEFSDDGYEVEFVDD